MPARELPPGVIHVWRVPLDREVDPAVLDDAERARAARFRVGAARRRFVASHSVLRRILEDYAGAPVRFGRGEFGKPYIPGSAIRFSLSHSGDLALIAVSRGAEVGVDIEQIRSEFDAAGIARRFFPPQEAAAVAADPGCFFRLWTRREACLKLLGTGLAGIAAPFPDTCVIAELKIAPGFAAAVAAERPMQIETFTWKALS